MKKKPKAKQVAKKAQPASRRRVTKLDAKVATTPSPYGRRFGLCADVLEEYVNDLAKKCKSLEDQLQRRKYIPHALAVAEQDLLLANQRERQAYEMYQAATAELARVDNLVQGYKNLIHNGVYHL